MKKSIRNNIYLTGFMGSGKSTVGPLVAESLGRRFLDTDCLVEQVTGMAIPVLFEKYGETGFRKAESQVMGQIAHRGEFVVALGGGALTVRLTAELVLDTGKLIYLRTGVETLVERLDVQHRPILRDLHGPALVSRVRELLAAREASYKIAHIQIDTDGKKPKEVAEAVIRELVACAG